MPFGPRGFKERRINLGGQGFGSSQFGWVLQNKRSSTEKEGKGLLEDKNPKAREGQKLAALQRDRAYDLFTEGKLNQDGWARNWGIFRPLPFWGNLIKIECAKILNSEYIKRNHNG